MLLLQVFILLVPLEIQQTTTDSLTFYLNEANSLSEQRFDYSKYEALDSYTKALNYLRRKQEKGLELILIEAKILDEIGDLYDQMRLRDEARKMYLESYSIRNLHSSNLSQSYLRLAKINYRFGYEKGNLFRAISYSKKAIQTLPVHNKSDLTEAYYWLANAYYNIKYEEDINEKVYLDSAIFSAQKAVQLLSNEDKTEIKINLNNLLSNLYMSSNRLDKAYAYLISNLNILKSIDSENRPIEQAYYASTYSRLANYHKQTGLLDSSLYYSNLRYSKVVGLLMQNERETSIRITEDYRTDKQLDQAEETAFLASQRAKTYGIAALILLLILAVSYLIFLQTIQRKKLENLQAVVLGEEQERKRLAKDLHDGIGVLLTSIRMRLASFEEKVDDQEAYHDSLEQIDNACTEVRRVSHNLSPASLEKLGLEEALLDLVDQVKLSGDLEVKEEVSIAQGLLKTEDEVLVYRIVQELINNTLKYAEASKIELSLLKEANELRLSFNDNGKGFDQQKVKPGIGLKSIASRLDILKGKMNFNSQLGKGTHFEISIPIHV